MSHPALELSGLWESSHQLMFHEVEIPLVVQSPTQVSYVVVSDLTPYCSTKASQTSQYRRQNPKSNDESNTQ